MEQLNKLIKTPFFRTKKIKKMKLFLSLVITTTKEN